MRPDAPSSSAPLASSTPSPSAGALPRELRRRPARDAGGEPTVELVVPRVVGPGRLERGYLERIAQLEGERHRATERERELELARLVERGSQRRLDRVEAELGEAQRAAGEAQRAAGEAQRAAGEARALERRLCAAIGALQRENALLVDRLERHEAARLAPPRRPLLARLFRSQR